MNLPNEFRKLRRLVGPAAWLFVFLAAHTPEGWVGDAPTWVAGGNIISDGELAERLQITLGTVASWRRRLRKAQLLDWLLRPGVGRVYIIGIRLCLSRLHLRESLSPKIFKPYCVPQRAQAS